MHELNHDMEDLFRRAAESYPLKTPSNWDGINRKLDELTPGLNQEDKKKKRRLLFLLLFLFLAAGSFISILWIFPVSKNAKKNNNPITSIESDKTLKQKTNNLVIMPDKINHSQTVSDPSGFSNSKETIYPTARHNRKTNDSPYLINNKNAGTEIKNQNYYNEPLTGNLTLNQEFPDNINITNYLNEPVTVLNYPAFFIGGTPIIANRVTVASRITELEKLAVKSMLQKRNSPNNQPRLYFGVTAGPAINSVKSFGRRWAVKGGLFAGLQFGNRISAETGLLFTKNYYEAKSEHFDEKGIAGMLTGGRQLNEVHGSNKMFEIPLSIRYKFSPRTKSIYAGAGLTSHIMTRESNWYLTTMNGTNEMLYGDYDKKKIYFASALTILTGFQAPLGKNTTIRVEPFTQLPLKGIGIGKIKLMSTGLNISLSKTTQ
jgi:hypothetical protein